jgi:hypothetical protein
MDTGLATAIRSLPGKELPLVSPYRDFLADCQFAEELGFSQVRASEHRCAEDDWNHSPLTLRAPSGFGSGPACARRGGSRDRRHPFERQAGLGHRRRSGGGRVRDVRVRPQGSHCADRRRPESLRALLYRREFDSEGKYDRFRNVTLRPKGVQQPHPPIWMAAMGPQSFARTARRGNKLAFAMHTSLWRGWAELLEQAGQDIQDLQRSRRERRAVLPAGLHAHGRSGPRDGFQVDLVPGGTAYLAVTRCREDEEIQRTRSQAGLLRARAPDEDGDGADRQSGLMALASDRVGRGQRMIELAESFGRVFHSRRPSALGPSSIRLIQSLMRSAVSVLSVQIASSMYSIKRRSTSATDTAPITG